MKHCSSNFTFYVNNVYNVGITDIFVFSWIFSPSYVIIKSFYLKCSFTLTEQQKRRNWDTDLNVEIKHVQRVLIYQVTVDLFSFVFGNVILKMILLKKWLESNVIFNSSQLASSSTSLLCYWILKFRFNTFNWINRNIISTILLWVLSFE